MKPNRLALTTEKMLRRRFLSGLSAAALGAFAPLPGLAGKGRNATGYLRTNWSQDPFSHGSYSFIAKGATRSDHRALAAPIADKLFFAGEAAHPDYNSTVHAAFESGARAAENVIATGAKRTLVIGAGISGLTAAQRLQDEGRDVVIIEGRGRIGGRIWTDHNLGLPLDLGASWIHGTTGNPIARLADARTLPTVKTNTTHIIRDGRGRDISDLATASWFDEVAEIEHVFGASPAELNQAAYADADDYDGPDVIFPGGYEQVLAAFDALDIRLNEAVLSVSYGLEGVSANTTIGTHQPDAVIVTVPLGVLKAGDIRFDPPLPPRTQGAIARLGMGVLDKLYLQFDEAFWDRGATWILTPDTGLPRGQFNQWFNIAKYVEEPILLGFNGANPARDLSILSDEQMLERALGVLTKAYPT